SPAGLHALSMIDDAAFLSTSTDGGQTWSQVMVVDGGIARDLAVTDDGTLVVFGWEHLGEDRNTPTAWYSTDGGVDFTRAALPVDPGPFVADEIESTPVGLIARVVDDAGTAHEWLSHDGATWQEVLQTSGYPFPGAYGSEALLFGDHHLWHSFDGTTW